MFRCFRETSFRLGQLVRDVELCHHRVPTRGGNLALLLRVLFLLVMVLAVVEYLFGSILDASPFRIYIYKNFVEGEFCKITSKLGPVPVNKSDIDIELVEIKYPEVYWGGQYTPKNCTARDKVAIIVPYRNRPKHLPIFINHMHPFLMKQKIEYGIFIIEQEGNKTQFNRATLMNVGFVESQKLKPDTWQCFIFHDIDLLPLDLRNLYTCPDKPRHMSAAVDTFNFILIYEQLFGGVSALTYEQFTKVNGFSNKYWGWGGEDDDLYNRLRDSNYKITRYNMTISRYTMLGHKKETRNPRKYQLLTETRHNSQNDGLTTLKYKMVQVAKRRLYTLLTVNIDEMYIPDDTAKTTLSPSTVATPETKT